MTLTRRIGLFIAGLLLLALGGALVVHTLAARAAVQQQQEVRNRDTAAALALALSQQHGDPVALQAVASAQFDLGHYRRIALRPANGPTNGPALIDLNLAPPPSQAPAWFVDLLPLEVAPGTALVSNGWTELGTLSVEAHTAWAHEVLWQACARTAALLAALALAAGGVTVLLLRAWQRPLQATVEQARLLEQGRFVEAPLPDLPELRELTRSMNTTVRRLHEMFASLASQVAWLQRQAQLDPTTGLPSRRQFMLSLAGALRQPPAWRPGLVVVRLPDLEQINQARGREAADALLRRVADVVASRLRREPDLLAGRLGGGDFAVLLPLPGMAARLVTDLKRALAEALGMDAPWPLLAGIERLEVATADEVLRLADSLLDDARARDDRVCVPPLPLAAAIVTDVPRLQAKIAAALADGRARLGEFAVLGPAGRLVHLECPLRLQLEPEGDFSPASHWLAAARRGGQLPQVDLAAIRLALYAIALDRRPRAVNVELSSLHEPGFVAAVSTSLGSAGDAARLLSIEWVADGAGGELPSVAAQAIEVWRPSGVHMGAEHAGAAPEQLAQLRDLGFDYVKVDSRHLRGAAHDPAVQAYARSLVGLVQLLGMQALAEGVDDGDDLALLWQLGFDGATGSAVGGSTASASAGAAPAPSDDDQPRGRPQRSTATASSSAEPPTSR